MTSAGMRPRVDTLCPLRRAQSRIAALCSRSIAPRPRPEPGTPTPATADATARLDPLLQIVAQFRGILGRKIDLIGHPVEPEFDRFVGGTLTVEIVDQGDGNFLRHWLTLAFLPEQLLSSIRTDSPVTNVP